MSDGGTAFPVQPYATDPKNWSDGSEGMSLRDYFAAAIMQGLVSNNGGNLTESIAAKWCYEMADAMLKARNKG